MSVSSLWSMWGVTSMASLVQLRPSAWPLRDRTCPCCSMKFNKIPGAPQRGCNMPAHALFVGVDASEPCNSLHSAGGSVLGVYGRVLNLLAVRPMTCGF